MKNLKMKLGIVAIVVGALAVSAIAQVKDTKAPTTNSNQIVTVTLVRWPYT